MSESGEMVFPNVAVTKSTFLQLAIGIQNREHKKCKKIEKRDFTSLFGVSPRVCTAMWYMLKIPDETGILPIHYMWALLFLTVYAKEPVLCALTKTTKKTFRKWVWKVIPRIAGTYPLLVSSVSLSYLSFVTRLVLSQMCQLIDRSDGQTVS